MGCFSSPSTKIQSASTLTKDQQSWMKQVADQLMPMVGQSDEVYQGQRVADLTPLQSGAYDTASTTGMDTLKNMMSGDYLNDYASNLWQNTVMPGVMERAAGMDSAGSGGTTQALMKGGQNMISQLAPLQLQAAQTGISGLSDMASLGAQQQQQAQNQLSSEYSKWSEGQPMNSKVWDMLPMLFGQQKENAAAQSSGGLGTQMLGGMSGGIGTALGNWLF